VADSDPSSHQRIGACFSGGGFRASFFALGSLRYLAEAGLLPQLAAISAVSGGSIAAAAAANRWDAVEAGGSDLDAFMKNVYEPFRSTVTSRDLRNEWLRHVPLGALRLRGRGKVMAKTLADALYKRDGDRVKDLPAGPQAVFTSTDLATGRALRVSRDFIGSYDFRYKEPVPDAVKLSTAVAASAAVPFLFPPVVVKSGGLDLRKPPKKLSLVDGGVYDNLGYEWFMPGKEERPDSFVEPDFIVMANASGPLRRKDRSFFGVRSANRSRAVQYSQTINLRVRWFVRALEEKEIEGAYVGITRDPHKFRLPNGKEIEAHLHSGALDSDLVPLLADLRTDLNKFRPEEADLLAYHAYWSLHARLGSLYPKMAVEQPQWTDYADLSRADVASLTKLLVEGKYKLRAHGKLRARFWKKS
jgi:NTE family protein